MIAITEAQNLKNQLLIAMPNLNDATFNRAVAFICEHDEKGATALIINKPMKMTLGDVLNYLKIPIDDPVIAGHPILMGGPLGQEQGFILHKNPNTEPNESEFIVSSSKEMLESIARKEDRDPMIVCLGYSGWDAGQLEQEIAQNSWLIAPATTGLLFETAFNQRWRAAALSTGVDFNRMTSEVGHA